MGLLAKRWSGAQANEGKPASASDTAVDAPPDKAKGEAPAKKKAPRTEARPADAAEAEEARPANAGAKAKKAAPPVAPKSKHDKRRKQRKKARKRMQQGAKKKDPEAAAAYLEAWDALRTAEEGQGGGGWRFNKATQTWLLRHAYDPELVPKGVFPLLLRYLEGLRGAARERLQAEADTIVLLQGAPVAPPAAAPEDAPAEGDASEPKKGSKRRGGSTAGPAEGEAGEHKKGKKVKGGGAAEAPGAADGADGGGDPTEGDANPDAKSDEIDVKSRRLRLRRARKILTVLGVPDS